MDVNFRGTQYSILGGAKASCRNCGQYLGNEGPSTGHTGARGKVVLGPVQAEGLLEALGQAWLDRLGSGRGWDPWAGSGWGSAAGPQQW